MQRLLLFSLSVFCAFAYNNGYGRQPFLGWNTWCAVGKLQAQWTQDSHFLLLVAL
jgi:hypothetical protein